MELKGNLQIIPAVFFMTMADKTYLQRYLCAYHSDFVKSITIHCSQINNNPLFTALVTGIPFLLCTFEPSMHLERPLLWAVIEQMQEPLLDFCELLTSEHSCDEQELHRENSEVLREAHRLYRACACCQALSISWKGRWQEALLPYGSSRWGQVTATTPSAFQSEASAHLGLAGPILNLPPLHFPGKEAWESRWVWAIQQVQTLKNPHTIILPFQCRSAWLTIMIILIPAIYNLESWKDNIIFKTVIIICNVDRTSPSKAISIYIFPGIWGQRMHESLSLHYKKYVYLFTLIMKTQASSTIIVEPRQDELLLAFPSVRSPGQWTGNRE